MERKILVAGSYQSSSFLVPLLFGGTFIALGILFLIMDHEAGWGFLGVGVLLTLVATGIFVHLSLQRCWVQATDQGLLIEDRLGSREYADDQVCHIGMKTSQKFSEGLPHSVARVVHLGAAGEGMSEVITMTYSFKLDDHDPLGNYFDRLLNHLHERSQRCLEAGNSVAGERWELSRGGLHLSLPNVPDLVPIDTLSAVGVFDDRVSIWIEGQEEALIKIPCASPNALVLHRLLNDSLSKRPTSKVPESADGLGRVLFARKPREIALYFFFGVTMIILVAILLIKDYFIFSLILTLFSILAAVVGVWARSYRSFSCHEYGVRRTSWQGVSEIRYEDVQSFTYNAVRQFVNGVYSGSTFTLEFLPAPESASKKIAYSASLQGIDEELEGLRDHISRVIAARMGRELSAGNSVHWTSSLSILPEGIEHRAKGFLGAKAPVLIPFAEVTGIELQQGTFHLWVQGKKKSVIQEEVSAPNFFPGYVLLQNIFHPEAQG